MKKHVYHSLSQTSQSEKRKQLFLSPDEYAMVMSAFNTHMTDDERKQRIVAKPIGDYEYVIINKGFDDYIVIGKYPINGDYERNWEDA